MINHPHSTPIFKRLEGKVAVITGGASGIGESIVRLYIKYGAKVIIADIQDELGHSLCKELGTEETISYVHCDVTSDSDVQNVVDMAVSKHGRLDIMCNNAGITGQFYQSIFEVDNQDFKRVLDVNLFGSFLGAKHAARVMVPAKRGCILFTGSLVSEISVGPGGGFTSYVASKSGIVGLAKSLCVELGQYGIRVNCISPFAVATPASTDRLGIADKSVVEEVVSESANLKGVPLQGEDVAEAAVYLGSDESKYVSGINLMVDGGYSQVNPSLSMAMQNHLS